MLRFVWLAMLSSLFLAGSTLAEDEKQSHGIKTPVSASAGEVFERQDPPVSVDVRNDGGQIIVDADFVVPVIPEQAWEVLTDFDNLPRFNSGIRSSKVTGRAGNVLQVAQKAVTKYGPLTFSHDSVREVTLVPHSTIHERLISGHMRRMEETTWLSPEGGHTRVVYHAVFVPGNWVPVTVTNLFMKREARVQFQELANEMVRRHRLRLARR